jgi:hypothetical protein
MSRDQRRGVLNPLKLRQATFQLLDKLHGDGAPCGQDGAHWPECEALVALMGWESWPAWYAWERERAEAEA